MLCLQTSMDVSRKYQYIIDFQTHYTNLNIESTKNKNLSVKSTHSQDRKLLHTKNNFYNIFSIFFSFVLFFFLQLQYAGNKYTWNSLCFLSYGAVLFSSARKSPIRTYSRTNKVVARPPELLLSSPLLLPHYQQASQITYTSVFSPRSQYVLILPLPWKNTKINRFINGDEVEGGRWGVISSIRLPFV